MSLLQRFRHRSAKTGRFVKQWFAERFPYRTVREKVKPPKDTPCNR